MSSFDAEHLKTKGMEDMGDCDTVPSNGFIKLDIIKTNIPWMLGLGVEISALMWFFKKICVLIKIVNTREVWVEPKTKYGTKKTFYIDQFFKRTPLYSISTLVIE